MGVLMQGGVAKEKVNSYFRCPAVGITVSASALMYMDCMYAVMLKPASIHFTLSQIMAILFSKENNIKKYFECFCK